MPLTIQQVSAKAQELLQRAHAKGVSIGERECAQRCAEALNAIARGERGIYGYNLTLTQCYKEWHRLRHAKGKEWDIFRDYYQGYLNIAQEVLALLQQADPDQEFLSEPQPFTTASMDNQPFWLGENQNWYMDADL